MLCDQCASKATGSFTSKKGFFKRFSHTENKRKKPCDRCGKPPDVEGDCHIFEVKVVREGSMSGKTVSRLLEYIKSSVTTRIQARAVEVEYKGVEE